MATRKVLRITESGRTGSWDEVQPGEPDYKECAIDCMCREWLKTPEAPPVPADPVKALEALLVGRVRNSLPISREEVELLRFLDAKQPGHMPQPSYKGN